MTCEGYTDSNEAGAHNHRLGLERARAVCQRLRHLGVDTRTRAVS